MTRKLSVTEARKRLSFLGTLLHEKSGVASANWPEVALGHIREYIYLYGAVERTLPQYNTGAVILLRAERESFSMRAAAIATLDEPTVCIPLQYMPLCEDRRFRNHYLPHAHVRRWRGACLLDGIFCPMFPVQRRNSYRATGLKRLR